ncbi:RNA polymerase II mediator complex subunit [Blyttiomyces sp. JEL0837]|nr:RNA polymerase II mediator complex subunit [Blyttiomyces sp. JEL0837]
MELVQDPTAAYNKFFPPPEIGVSASTHLIASIRKVLDWAIGDQPQDSFDDGRYLLASSAIRKFLDSNSKIGDVKMFVQKVLFSIVDEKLHQHQGLREDDLTKLIVCYESLQRAGVFSYAYFINCLIARGDLDDCASEDQFSKNLRAFLAQLPIYDQNSETLNYRRFLLFGSKHKKLPDNDHETLLQLQDLVYELFPSIYPNKKLDLSLASPLKESENVKWDTVKAVSKKLKEAMDSSTRFSVSLLCDWIGSQAQSFVVQAVAQYCSMVETLLLAKGFSVIVDISIWLLSKSGDRNLPAVVLETFKRLHYEYMAMGELGRIFEMLWNKFEKNLKSTKIGGNDRHIAMYLLDLVHSSEIECSPEQRKELEDQLKPVVSKTSRDVAQEFYEIRDLKDTEESVGAAISNLHYRYSFNSESSKRIFFYSIDVLKKFAIANSKDPPLIRRRLEITIEVLKHFNDPSNYMEQVIIDFFGDLIQQNPKHSELLSDVIGTSGSRGWFLAFLMKLITWRICSPSILLSQFIIPALTKLSNSSYLFKNLGVEVFLNVAFILKTLFFLDSPNDIFKCCVPTQKDLHCLEAIRAYDLKQNPSTFLDIIHIFHLLSQINFTLQHQIGDGMQISQQIDKKALALEYGTKLIETLLNSKWLTYARQYITPSKIYSNLVVPWVQQQRTNAAAAAAVQTTSRKDKKSTKNVASTVVPEKKPPVADVQRNSFAYFRKLCLLLKAKSTNSDIDGTKIGVIQTAQECLQLFRMIMEHMDNGNLLFWETQLRLLFEQISLCGVQWDSDFTEIKVLFKKMGSVLISLEKVDRLEPSTIVQALNLVPLELILEVVQELQNQWTTQLETYQKDKSLFLEKEVFRQEETQSLLLKCCLHLMLCQPDGKFATAIGSRDVVTVAFAKSLFAQFKSILSIYVAKPRIEVLSPGPNGPQSCSAPNDVVSSLLEISQLRELYMTRLHALAKLIPFLFTNAAKFAGTPPEVHDFLSLVEVLLNLLISPIVHSYGAQETVFEFSLDVISSIIDESSLNKDIKDKMLGLLRDMQPKLSPPADLADRVSRILPFQVGNIYSANLIIVSNPATDRNPTHVSTPGNSVSTPAGSATAPASASNSNVNPSSVVKPFFLLENWQDTNPVPPYARECEGSAWAPPPLSILNNTPLSLSMFGATSVGGDFELSHKRLFADGWRPGVPDDTFLRDNDVVGVKRPAEDGDDEKGKRVKL